jgi:hypothetical protein
VAHNWTQNPWMLPPTQRPRYIGAAELYFLGRRSFVNTDRARERSARCCNRLGVGALLAAELFDEPHKSLIGGGDDLVEEASILVSPMVIVDEPTRSHAT